MHFYPSFLYTKEEVKIILDCMTYSFLLSPGMDCRPQQRFRESFGVHMQVDMVADAWLLTQFDAINGELDGIDAQHQYLHHLASQLEKACELIHKSYSICRQFAR